MKKYFITLLMSIFTVFAFGQKIEVTGTYEKLDDENQSALTVFIFDAEEDVVRKKWKSLMKKYDAKFFNRKKEMIAESATIKSISKSNLWIYAVANQKGVDGVQLTVGFKANGVFLSSGKDYNKAKDFLEDFAERQTIDAIATRVKIETKNLGKEQRRLENLVNENKNLKSSIETYKQKIIDAEAAIVTNEENQVTQKKAIENQQNKVNEIEEKLNKFK